MEKKADNVATNKRNLKKTGKIVLVVFLALVALSALTGGGDQNTEANVSTDSSETKKDDTVKEEEADEPVVPAEYRSALSKAKTYATTMHMSKASVYDQLTSEYGEKFSPEAAQYAMDNVTADWSANALAKARTYQDSMSMSPAAIRDQLVSDYGEKFTAEEADYALANLEK